MAGVAALAMTQVILAATAVEAKPLRTPRAGWVRTNMADHPTSTLVNSAQTAIIRASLQAQPPGNDDIAQLLLALTGQESFTIRSELPRDALAEAGMQRGFSFVLPNGKRGIYLAIWGKRRDGQIAVSAYATTDVSVRERYLGEFQLAQSLSNQVRRGALPGVPAVARQPVLLAAALPVDAAMAVPAPLPSVPPATAPEPVATAPIIVPSAAAVAAQPPLAASGNDPAPTPGLSPPATQAIGLPAPIAVAAKPPLPPGTGVPIGQLAAILYAPLESSSVFVLFKDGSFHETLPMALEDWNAAGSRRSDTDNWGKWKKAKDDGEYEMQYGPDDVVTIAAARVPPAAKGVALDGRYILDTDEAAPDLSANNAIEFTGDRFRMAEASAVKSGDYAISNYTIELRFDDGQTRRLPFFTIPAEEPDDEPGIWIGDALWVKE